MRRTFGKVLVQLARKDPRIVLLIADVYQEMDNFVLEFPARIFNVGLCEQTMIGMAAGMAIEGLRPVVYTLTPFLLERPFEQVKLDIDEQNLPVMLVGNADYPTHGPTHRALNAEGLVGLLKNTVGYFPRNAVETEKAMLDAYLMGAPAVICLQNDRMPTI
jgi:transketolase